MKYKVIFSIPNKSPVVVEAERYETLANAGVHNFFKDNRLVATFNAHTTLGVVEADAIVTNG